MSDQRANSQTVFLLFSILLVLILLVGAGLYHEIKILGSTRPQTQTPALAIATTNDVALALKLDYLEKSLQFALDNSQKSAQQLSTVFTTVSAFATILALYFGVRQVLSDAKQTGRQNEHDKEMRSLASSFQHNITTISSLISTLEKSYAYRKEVEEQINIIQERAQIVEKDMASREQHFLAEVATVNERAVALFLTGINSARYIKEKASDILELDGRVKLVEQLAQARGLLNPFVHFIRALVHFTKNVHDTAALEFLATAREADGEKGKSNQSKYPEKYHSDLSRLLSELITKCYYFSAISNLETGRFTAAANYAEKAIQSDVLHLDARILWLQVLYNDPQTEPARLLTEYESTYTWLESIAPASKNDIYKKGLKLLKLNEGIALSMKRIIPDGRKNLASIQNADGALACFKTAYEFEPSSRTAYGFAAALDEVSPFRRNQHNSDLIFKEALERLNKRIALGGDDAYLSYIYYMAAIVKNRLGLPGAGDALARARGALSQLPVNIWCMTPISGLYLDRSKLLEEMTAVERTFKT